MSGIVIGSEDVKINRIRPSLLKGPGGRGRQIPGMIGLVYRDCIASRSRAWALEPGCLASDLHLRVKVIRWYTLKITV